jgi:hypothetical protein
MIARIIERIVARGANETAERVLRHIRAVFELAQTRTDSRLPENPATAARAVLRKRKEHVPRTALLNVDALRDVLERAQRADLSPAVHQAHRLAAFTGARIGNIAEGALGRLQPRWRDADVDDPAREDEIEARASSAAQDPARADDHGRTLGVA